MFSCRGKEKIVAGSSFDANNKVKFGPKHATATRPLGTVHLSACHDVATPVFQTLHTIINELNKILCHINIKDTNSNVLYLNIFLQEAENNREPHDDHRIKHKPSPPTRLNGTPSFLEVSQIIIRVSAGEQDTNRSPCGCHVTLVTGAWFLCFNNTAWLRKLLAAPISIVQTKTPAWHATASSLPESGLQLMQHTDFWAPCLKIGTTGISWEKIRMRSSLVTIANRAQCGCHARHLI